MAIILRTRHFGALWIASDLRLIPNEQRTPEVLRGQQAAYVAKNPATHPPVELTDERQAFVGNGCWRIHCRCREATHTDPEWKLACCFSCGAIWTNVTFPDDWKEIEELLSKRAVQSTRNWELSETYMDLVAEQMDHGEPTI